MNFTHISACTFLPLADMNLYIGFMNESWNTHIYLNYEQDKSYLMIFLVRKLTFHFIKILMGRSGKSDDLICLQVYD